jgi:hypothetical protein
MAMRFPSLVAPLAALTLASTLAVRVAHADPPPPELMSRLAATSAAMEDVRNRVSYAIETRVEELDGDGKVTSTKTTSARVVKDEKGSHMIVLKEVEDGKDTTEDARKEIAKQDARSDADKKKEHVEIPFTAAQQTKYVFDQVETDPAAPTRVRITFKPKDPDSHSVDGSAWVDTTSGQFLSAGFKIAKPGMFVDFAHVTVEVGGKTEIGPVVSKITFEGKGGFLFIHKHFRGSAVMSDYKVTK